MQYLPSKSTVKGSTVNEKQVYMGYLNSYMGYLNRLFEVGGIHVLPHIGILLPSLRLVPLPNHFRVLLLCVTALYMH